MSAKSYSRQLDTTTTNTMMNLASQLAHARRMRQLFKRARLNRAPALAPTAAASATHTSQRRSDEGMIVSNTAPSTTLSDVTNAQRKELVDIGRHFSKIASRYTFENDAASYNAWAIK